MSLPSVRTGSASVLREHAEEIEQGEDVTELIASMYEVMCKERGIGLAANQIGVLKRVILISANGLNQEFINPVITKRYGGKHTAKEGCLSFPGAQVIRVRDKQIIVEGFDKNWKPVKRKLTGLAARCVQHEVDHLNGVVIGDN
jgi:peptide deformylase